MSNYLPKHIAIVMDGNGRWAQEKQRQRIDGHQEGIESLKTIIHVCAEKKIQCLSLFAFSSENWSRPKNEVAALMTLFFEALANEIDELHQNQVRLNFIGDLDRFNSELQGLMHAAADQTAKNTGLHLIIAVNYGGQWDIIQAAKSIAQQVARGEIAPENIDKHCLEQSLCLSNQPYPDLLIRTSGEQRISNFFLWQAAYCELYFTDTYWPAFREAALDQALEWYATRQRRFGKINEQLESQ